MPVVEDHPGCLVEAFGRKLQVIRGPVHDLFQDFCEDLHRLELRRRVQVFRDRIDGSQLVEMHGHEQSFRKHEPGRRQRPRSIFCNRNQRRGHIERVALRAKPARAFDLRQFAAARHLETKALLDRGIFFGGRIEQIDPDAVRDRRAELPIAGIAAQHRENSIVGARPKGPTRQPCVRSSVCRPARRVS